MYAHVDLMMGNEEFVVEGMKKNQIFFYYENKFHNYILYG